jgi:hypothetical protein
MHLDYCLFHKTTCKRKYIREVVRRPENIKKLRKIGIKKDIM